MLEHSGPEAPQRARDGGFLPSPTGERWQGTPMGRTNGLLGGLTEGMTIAIMFAYAVSQVQVVQTGSKPLQRGQSWQPHS